jgi:putative transposase
MGWNKQSQCYELRACYLQSSIESIDSTNVAAVDLGEIHPMVIADGINTDIYNGRLLRSKRQYQNKLKAKLSKLVDKKKRGSRRKKKLIKSKQKQLAKINNQIKDIEHKLIRQKLEYKCARVGIQTELISEEYTSQECLSCRKRNKPKNRNYRCSCSFQFHRDGVGSNNIRAKYLGQVPVVGLMASPVGVRWNPHIQCNPID